MASSICTLLCLSKNVTYKEWWEYEWRAVGGHLNQMYFICSVFGVTLGVNSGSILIYQTRVWRGVKGMLVVTTPPFFLYTGYSELHNTCFKTVRFGVNLVAISIMPSYSTETSLISSLIRSEWMSSRGLIRIREEMSFSLTHIHKNIYVYACTCLCMCVYIKWRNWTRQHASLSCYFYERPSWIATRTLHMFSLLWGCE